MVTLLYHAEDVGPVCSRVAQKYGFRVIRDTTINAYTHCPRGVLVRWGSMWVGDAVITINTPQAVALARNKSNARRALRTLSPLTWWAGDDIVKLPCIIRPKNHFAARRFFVCRSPLEIKRAIKRCKLGWYASELINKIREFRIFVLKNRVVCASERFPATPTAIAWNLAMGGRLINIPRREVPKSVKVASLKALQLLQLDWGAVDVALDREGKVFVFEVNTAPGLRNPYTISKIASAFKRLDT